MPRPKGSKNKKATSKPKVVKEITIEKLENGYLVTVSYTDFEIADKKYTAITLLEATNIVSKCFN